MRSRPVALGSAPTLEPARRVHGRLCGHGGPGPPVPHAARPGWGLGILEAR